MLNHFKRLLIAMNNEWNVLIEHCTEKGYGPHDVQRIVMLYDMMKEHDEKLKEQFYQEENEEAPF
jgi:hypothetical protein